MGGGEESDRDEDDDEDCLALRQNRSAHAGTPASRRKTQGDGQEEIETARKEGIAFVKAYMPVTDAKTLRKMTLGQITPPKTSELKTGRRANVSAAEDGLVDSPPLVLPGGSPAGIDRSALKRKAAPAAGALKEARVLEYDAE